MDPLTDLELHPKPLYDPFMQQHLTKISLASHITFSRFWKRDFPA